MRWLSGLLLAFVAGTIPAGAQYTNTIYYSPGAPLSPTDSKACSDFAAEWDAAISKIEKDHQDCLDAHSKDPNIPNSGDVVCSRAACQILHNIMFRFRNESKAEIDACNKQVEDYQKAEEARKADSARKAADLEARKLAAEEQRQAQEKAAEEAKQRRAEEAERQKEAAKAAAAAEAQRAKERDERQKLFDEQTKQRNEERDRLARAQSDADAKLAEAQRKLQDQASSTADRQMDAFRTGAAPPPTDPNAAASGFDFSGVGNTSGDDSRLFNIDAASAQRVLNEVAQRVRDAGQLVIDKAGDYAKDQLSGYFTSADHEPYGEVVKDVVSDAAKTSESDDLDRGAWLRSQMVDQASSNITDWLQDNSVEAGAKRSDDPLEYQVNRTFSAAQIWNAGFGFKNYLTKISDEGLKAIGMGFGMIMGDTTSVEDKQ